MTVPYYPLSYYYPIIWPTSQPTRWPTAPAELKRAFSNADATVIRSCNNPDTRYGIPQE